MQNQIDKTDLNKSQKVAIIHDFFFQNGGAEKVVETLLKNYPKADIYTTIFIPQKFSKNPLITKAYEESRIKTTWINWFFNFKDGWLLKYFKHFFWLYPIVMRFVCIKNYNIAIISSTDCAKQVKFQNVSKIFHYCHSPTRYLHGLITETDHQNLSKLQKFVLKFTIPFLRRFDLQAVKRLNKTGCEWIANSNYIKTTIKKIYNTESTVTYPPVEIDKFLTIQRAKQSDDFYFCHGRISFHKRLDLAIQACLQTSNRLKISGTAAMQSQIESLQKIVTDFEKANPSKTGLIEFLGRTSDQTLFENISRCKGFLFPGKEDFGIAPVEMLASGVPIIAYQSGGALEYVKEHVNGVFFAEQTVDSLISAINKFEKIKEWNAQEIKTSSKAFGEKHFLEQITKLTNQ